MSNQKTLDKIDLVYEKAQKMKLNFDPSKPDKNLSNGTYNTYKNVIKGYANYLYETHGITDIAKAKPRMAYEYMDAKIDIYVNKGVGSAYTMRQFGHALESFRQASAKTGVFKRECKIGDKRVILEKLTDEGIFRKSEESKSLKANHEDYKKVDSELGNSRSEHRNEIRDIHALQRDFGARIIEAAGLRVKDVKFEGNRVRLQGKGGLVGYIPPDRKDAIERLKERCEGKPGNAPVFVMHGKDGNQKTKQEMAKLAEEQISKAAERAGVNTEDKKYTSHSGRKAFAQSRMDQYKKMSVSQLKREIAKRIKEDQEQKENKNRTSLKSKYDKTLKSVRPKIKTGNKNRDLNHRELCTWLVSVDLRHGRLDVVRYYADY